MFSLIMWGLGPTTDISPNKTFINCGISSKLVFLKNLPILVTLTSPFVAVKISAFELTTIDLNFIHLNSRYLYPLRFCEKKTGPLESSLIKIEIKGISHDNKKIITARGVILPRPAYDPIAAKTILVNTKGSTTADLKNLNFGNISRDLYPLQDSKFKLGLNEV